MFRKIEENTMNGRGEKIFAPTVLNPYTIIGASTFFFSVLPINPESRKYGKIQKRKTINGSSARGML
jgi:hypothetical protein